MGNTLVVWFTAVIAFATVAYAAVTYLLWKATRRSADAARASADAAMLSASAAFATAETARRSAELDFALHRPHLAVSVFQRYNDYNAKLWAVQCKVRNYGTLTAHEVRVEVAVDRDGRGEFGRGVVCTAWELAPAAEIEGAIEIGIDQVTRDLLPKGEARIGGHVQITYAAPDGRSFSYRADFPYERSSQNFKPERAETTGRDG